MGNIYTHHVLFIPAQEDKLIKLYKKSKVVHPFEEKRKKKDKKSFCEKIG